MQDQAPSTVNRQGTAPTSSSNLAQVVPETFSPCGVIAIITSPDGGVVATATDFARDGYGGMELWEAQSYRVRRRVLWDLVRAYSSPAMTDSLSDYLVEQIGQTLIGGRRDKGKHKLVLRVIGWPSDVREEIER